MMICQLVNSAINHKPREGAGEGEGGQGAECELAVPGCQGGCAAQWPL